MDNKRSYAKESYKSKPTGIRFNLEQERIAFMRTKKKTRQQLVDFLLENYIKGENPVVERMGIQDFTKPTNQVNPITDVKPIQNTTVSITGLPPKVSLFDDFISELKECRTIEQVEAVMKRVKGEAFVPRERVALENFAKEISKEMYND
jgi:hypothetical protein